MVPKSCRSCRTKHPAWCDRAQHAGWSRAVVLGDRTTEAPAVDVAMVGRRDRTLRQQRQDSLGWHGRAPAVEVAGHLVLGLFWGLGSDVTVAMTP